MTDFPRPYKGVAWFGIWAADTADDYGRRDAATILTGAVELCADEDMRENREVRAALAFLAQQGHDKRAIQFRRALDMQHPDERRQAADQALAAIRNALGLSWGKVPSRI